MTADVYVSIASYADPDVVQTVRNLLAAADRRIRVGVVLQYDDASQWGELQELGADVHGMHVSDARGCGWARAVGASMWEGEPWFYQCDAHMSFEPGWDSTFIRQCESMPAAGVLSAHPLDTGDLRRVSCVSDINGVVDHGCLTGVTAIPLQDAMLPARMVSGATQFLPSSILQAVPPDPNLMFWGEEQAMALRYWTHGFDLWHPGGPPMCRHRYMHERRVREDQYWVRKWPKAHAQNERAYRRLAVMYERVPETDDPLGVYGLGAERSLKAWQEFARVDLRTGLWTTDEAWRRGDSSTRWSALGEVR